MSALISDARRLMAEMAKHYRLHDKTLPERIRLRLDGARREKNAGVAADLVRVALERYQTHCLAAWAQGKALGPDTPEARERDAKRAESLARMLEQKGNSEAAEQQRRRAENLREGRA